MRFFKNLGVFFKYLNCLPIFFKRNLLQIRKTCDETKIDSFKSIILKIVFLIIYETVTQ